MMKIRKIDPDSRQDVRKIVRFPFDLNKNNPLWVPPFVNEVSDSIRGRHPFFEHSVAAFYVAESRGKVEGRIAVMENRRANEFRGTQAAFFGFFEALDNQELALRLFEATFEWSRARGLNKIIGPRGLIGSDSGGILIDGFEHRPALGVPYNPPYYDALIKTAGFTKDTDHLSGYLRGDHVLPDRINRIAEKIKVRRGYRIINFTTKEEMRAWVPKVQEVHREAFQGTHTFYPPTDKEMASIANTIISVADPSLIKLLICGEKIIGFIFAYHDISAGIQKSMGRIWPFGWFHILKERNKNDWVNINGVGMLPQYQGMGGNAILYAELNKSIKAFGFNHIDIVQVNETNLASFNDMEAIGVQWYKRHRSYQRDL